jgi:hypothetical protein
MSYESQGFGLEFGFLATGVHLVLMFMQLEGI